VSYIVSSIEVEIKRQCPQCNFTFPLPVFPNQPIVNVSNETNSTDGSGSVNNNTNGTDNSTDNSTSIDNSTNVDNSTNSTDNSTNVTTVGFWNSANYSLPSSCVYKDANNQTVRCSEGVMRSLSYNFIEVNDYWTSNLNGICADVVEEAQSCENSIIADDNTCLRLTFYNQCQLKGVKKFYGFLYFDQVAQSAAYNHCKSTSQSFNLTSEQFTASFQFAFGSL